MKIDSFYEYYDKVINVYINEIKQMDSYHCIKPVSEHCKRKVFEYYQLKRDELRRVYMKSPSQPLDRHKVAACMIYAILKTKVIRVNKMKDRLPDYLLMANEHLAITVALNIIELYKYHDNEKKQDVDISDFQYEIILPKTYHENRNDSSMYCTFMCNLCKYLYFVKRVKYFDVFAYATILFQLEKYTDTIIEMEQLKGTELKRDSPK